MVQLPAVITLGDRFAVPSLMAAFQLGLREHLGGAPDHLAVEQVVDPYLSDGTENRDALLVHDVVPGGTGYLAELADPQKVVGAAPRLDRRPRLPLPGREPSRLPPLPVAVDQRPLRSYVSRVAAERHLHDILLSGAADGEPDEASGGRSRAARRRIRPETHIEQRFRKVLPSGSPRGSVRPSRAPRSAGQPLDHHPGGGRTWTLEPQLRSARSKPDFVLVCNDPNVPRMAIFCDGWQFHASPVDQPARRRLRTSAPRCARRGTSSSGSPGRTWSTPRSEHASAPLVQRARWSQTMSASNGRSTGARRPRDGRADRLPRPTGSAAPTRLASMRSPSTFRCC